MFWIAGMGHMVGAGIFVLTGTVVKDEAGPAAILSYLLAGIGALLSALCYAEFGARVPKVNNKSDALPRQDASNKTRSAPFVAANWSYPIVEPCQVLTPNISKFRSNLQSGRKL